MWDLIDALTEPNGYEMFGVLAFLQHVPDRARAQAAFDRVGPLLLEQGLVALDPDAAGEVQGPLDFAPLPDSIARSLFDDATIAAHLDHLAAAQRDDGGWMFNWPVLVARRRGRLAGLPHRGRAAGPARQRPRVRVMWWGMAVGVVGVGDGRVGDGGWGMAGWGSVSRRRGGP